MDSARNEDLYQCLLNFANKSYDLLNNIHDKKRRLLRFKLNNDNKKSWNWIGRIDHRIFIGNHWDKVIETREYKDLEQHIESDDYLKHNFDNSSTTDTASTGLFGDWTFLDLISKLLETNSKKLVKPEFNRIYASMEKLLYSNFIPVKYLQPLTGLSAEEQIGISDHLRIRKLTMKEKEDWANLYLHRDIANVVVFTDYTVEYRYDVPKYAKLETLTKKERKITKAISDVVTGLRIVKDGLFENYSLIRKVDSYFPNRVYGIPSKHYTLVMLVGKYFLCKADKPRLLEYYNLLNHSNNQLNKIQNAMLWFNTYSVEMNKIKKVIYLAMVLESLMGDSKGSLSHKLCCRMANLLGSTYDNKLEIYKNIDEFYKARNRLLHGNESKPFSEINITDTHIRSMILKVLNIVKIFNSHLSLKKQYDDFLRKLDFNIN